MIHFSVSFIVAVRGWSRNGQTTATRSIQKRVDADSIPALLFIANWHIFSWTLGSWSWESWPEWPRLPVFSLWCHKGRWVILCWKATATKHFARTRRPLRVCPWSPFPPGAAPPTPLSKRHHSIFFCHFLSSTTLLALSSPSYLTPAHSRLFFSCMFF